MKISHTLILFLASASSVLPLQTTPQKSSEHASSDPLEQKVALELNDETIGDALGRLNQSLDLSISVEGVLPEEGKTTDPRFRADIKDHTVAEAFNWLCDLDPRYTWTRDGNMVNFFPRRYRDDQTYFFNRTLPLMHFENARMASDAAIQVVHQLGDPNENLICLSIGGNQTFAKAWSATFHDITVRQALNRIAQQLGPTYGWQIGGTTKQKMIIFYYKLGAHQFTPSPQE